MDEDEAKDEWDKDEDEQLVDMMKDPDEDLEGPAYGLEADDWEPEHYEGYGFLDYEGRRSHWETDDVK